MPNNNLKTKNEVLAKLNEKYYVIRRDKSPEYLIYNHPKGGGLSFMCKLEKRRNGNKSVYFNGKRYFDVDKLLKDVEVYNNTLPFPAMTYDPYLNKNYVTQWRIGLYLKKLGFTDINGETFVINGPYDTEIERITISSHNNVNAITRGIGTGKYVYIEFTNEEDAIEKINTMLSINASCNIEKLFALMENISGAFNGLDDAKVVSVENFLSGKKEYIKDKMIPMLEEVLSKLKEK